MLVWRTFLRRVAAMTENSHIRLQDGSDRESFRGTLRGTLLLSGLLLLPVLGWGQAAVRRPGGKPPADEKLDKVRVNVGVSTAKPEDAIDIPLTLGIPEGTKVSSITETVSYPKKVLALTKTELGLAGEQSEAEIKENVKDDASDASLSDLEVTISAKNGMKPGILAYLKMKVDPNATKSTVAIKIVDSKATSDAGQPLEMAKGKDGEVDIFNKDEEIPIVGCFFFSH